MPQFSYAEQWLRLGIAFEYDSMLCAQLAHCFLCKSATISVALQKSVQWLHRSVQPLHAFLVDRHLPRNIALRIAMIGCARHSSSELGSALTCTIIALQTGQCSPENDNDMSKGKRVRITNDSLNSYGTRVLTAGMNVEQYQRNPVLLYMHERGNVIGYVKDLKVENGEVTGELMFDEASELSIRCKKQYEFGSLKMVSAGLDILETSEDPELLVQGQTSPTITKSKLFEVSLVDIGANDDAIVLQKDGKKITLGKDSECPLPMLNNTNQKQMEQKQYALQLGLPETATDAEITAKLSELNAAKQENERLKKEKESLTLASITAVVEKAVGEKRIGTDKKDEFINLGKEIGQEKLERILSAMSPQMKLSAVVGHHGGASTQQPATYKKLSDVPSAELLTLRKDQPEEYKRLYKEEYGMACEL